MTEMATMAIYGKSPSKISGTGGPILMKLGTKHQWLKHSNVSITHDPVMTLTYFTARSTNFAYAFEFKKLLKCHLKEKPCRKWAVGQNIYDSEKMDPRSSSAFTLGQYTYILP